jgi:hypothetical protein
MSIIQTANRTMGDLVIASILLTVLGLMGINRQSLTPTASPPAVNVHATIIGKAQVPETQATIYSQPNCRPCEIYIGGTPRDKKGILDLMPLDGYVVRQHTDADAATAHVIIDKSATELERLKIDLVPCTIIRRAGVEKKRIYGILSSEKLDKLINEVAK